MANDYKNSMNTSKPIVKCRKCRIPFNKEELINISTICYKAYICKECNKTYNPSRRKK